MTNRNRKESNQTGKWIALAIFLLISNPVLVVPLGVFAGICWLVYRQLKKPAPPAEAPTRSASSTRYTTRQSSFDECPQPFFCRHKDKAEHHVRRGKEIDPWDRPDIDISKYQRNR